GFTTDSGVEASVHAPEDFPLLPSPVSAGLYRIGQEALSNIARHAQATRVGIAVSVEAGHVRLDIRDNGVGFDPKFAARKRTAPGRSGGFGLIGIRERAQLLGGTSEISSDIGEGTHILVRVPIQL